MPYSRDFFALQYRFAQRLATRFALPLDDALFRYTTFTKSFGTGEEWQVFREEVLRATEPLDSLWAYYQARCPADLTPADTMFHGQVLFGCFYYIVRDGHVIRPHLVRNDHSGSGILSRERVPVRRAELRAIFDHIQVHVPEADTVLGNSWLYNLDAYRRLYPPEYTRSLPESSDGEFQYLARWGQFFHGDWQLQTPLANELFRRLEVLEHLDDLRHCFPYPIRQPRCAIDHFRSFYAD